MPVRFLTILSAALVLLSSRASDGGAQVVGSTWTAPTYGFTVSWAGTEWQVDPEGNLSGVGPERLDRLHLVNGVSSLYFEGATRYEANLSSCVAEEANILSQEPGVSDVRPYRDASGVELIADGPDSSVAAFTLTLDVAGQELELVDYIECRTLIPGEAVLIVTLVTDPGTFEQELAAATAVMDTITLAENVPQSPLAAYGGLIAAAQERPSIAGPLAGEIAFGSGRLGVERTGVDAPDFYVRAEFANPEPATLRAWDFGIGFRDGGGEQQLRLVVDSAGDWFLKDGLGPVIAQGTLVDVDTSSSGSNIIEIVAVGESGFFAFNERLVSELTLPSQVAGGEIFAGAGFFSEDATEEGSTRYSDLEVWSLSGVEADETAPAMAIDAKTFAESETAATAATPLAGPIAGELRQTVGAAAIEPAGVMVEDFAAAATFVNPRDAAEGPWDFGIAFREQESGDHYRITVNSDGSWEYQIGLQPDLAGGVVPALNFAEGATNTIEVVVAGESAGFAVNGAFVSQLDVSALPGEGDVWIGAGFHRDNVAGDAVTRFADFTVWPLEMAAAAPIEATPAAAATPVLAPPSGAFPSEVALRLHEQNDSGIDALAVLRENDGGTTVSVVARDASGGEVAALYDGTCDEPPTKPLFLVGELDAAGGVETTIEGPLADFNDGEHSIAIHRGADDDEIVACGDIPAQE